MLPYSWPGSRHTENCLEIYGNPVIALALIPTQVGFRWARTLCERIDTYAIESNLRRAGVGAASQIFTFTSQQELRALYRLARNCPPGATMLEIGSYLGASTCYLGAGAAKIGGKVVCVDTWQNETMPDGIRDTYSEFLCNTEGIRPQLITVRKRSDQLMRYDVPGPINLAFIDGDHSLEAVRSDFERITPWLADDATIAFHDSLWYQGVSQTIGLALSSGAWFVAGCIENLCWIRRSTEDHWREAP